MQAGALLLVGVSASAADPVTPQAPHGSEPPARALAGRLQEADAAALVLIDAVLPDRFRVQRLGLVQGPLPERFAIKRSPSRSPRLAPGERLIATLRGARPPYLLGETPAEITRLEDAERGLRWLAAVQALEDAASRDARLELYDEWLAGDDDGLREEAVRGVAAGPAPPQAWLERIVVRAFEDPVPERREDLARALAASTAGSGLLAGALLDRAEPVPEEPWAVGLASAARDPALAGAVPQLLARALEHPRPGPRREALRHALAFAGHPQLARRLEALARDDPDEQVRNHANRILATRAQRELLR